MNDQRLFGVRFPIMLAVAALLVIAGWAGLIRLGWALPAMQANAVATHGALMVSGVLGTLICLERAAALGGTMRSGAAAYLAPALTGVGALLLAFGAAGSSGRILITLGSAGLVAVFAVIIRRQRAPYTIVMGLGALAWLVGNILWALKAPIYQLVYWWVAFFVLTIVGERLELARVMRVTRASQRAFLLAVGLLLAGVALTLVSLDVGARVAGAGEIALALWLLRYDIARQTVRKTGLTRFIAVCLLSGYGWLAVGGLLSIGAGAVYAGPVYDAVLHSVFLGFVFSMIFGHMPIVAPALTRRDTAYTPLFYAHAALLHVSLAARLAGDLGGWLAVRQWGGMLNAVAIVLFLALTVYSIAGKSPAARRWAQTKRAES